MIECFSFVGQNSVIISEAIFQGHREQLNMRSDLDYLPIHKQEELANVVSLIHEVVSAELIILFGSYARNEWVEEKYNKEHYRYQSDFDILVIVKTKSDAVQNRLEREIEELIEKSEAIQTPVSIIVHDIDFVNKRLSKAQYFLQILRKRVWFYTTQGHCN